MIHGYTPTCAACRRNDTAVFYVRCGGCQVRQQLQLHAEHADPARPISQAESDSMDSTMQPLEREKKP